MINIITEENRHLHHHALTEMHRQRKQLFIEKMRWSLEEMAGLEMDSFDTPSAIYLVETCPAGRVVQSARLLSTDRPHLLGDVFGALCPEGAPRSNRIWEASRFCPAPETPKGSERRELLMRMIAGIMEASILFGIEAVTFVASKALAPLALSAGWSVEELGPMRRVLGQPVVAMMACVSSDGLARVRSLNRLPGPLTCFADPASRRAA